MNHPSIEQPLNILPISTCWGRSVHLLPLAHVSTFFPLILADPVVGSPPEGAVAW